eukprot:jgi/Mesvir1/21760/Mv04165-RA.1
MSAAKTSLVPTDLHSKHREETVRSSRPNLSARSSVALVTAPTEREKATNGGRLESGARLQYSAVDNSLATVVKFSTPGVSHALGRHRRRYAVACSVGGIHGQAPGGGWASRQIFNMVTGCVGKFPPLASVSASATLGGALTRYTGPGDLSGATATSAKTTKDVLIIMSDTGGGHRASAEALKAVFAALYGDSYKVHIVDLWKHHTPPPFDGMPDWYNFMVKHEFLWRLAFHASRPKVVQFVQFRLTSMFAHQSILAAFQQYKPDVIVSVHPLLQEVPLRVLKKARMRTPFATVITDLDSCHPTWFHKGVDLCFVPTHTVYRRAIKAGLRPAQLRQHGLPIRPVFSKPVASKVAMRKALGVAPDLPLVMLAGGGEGMGPVEVIARTVASQLAATPGVAPAGQLVIICGRNEKLFKTLSAVSWPVPVTVKGFTNNMDEWMGAADILITKAGPGTIMEALIRGLPLILNSFIPGQERGNVSFVEDNGAGKFCSDPKKIAALVRGWFGERREELETMAANARKMGRPNAVFDIVRDIAALVPAKAVNLVPA